jgi:predicted phosphodiesterase
MVAHELRGLLCIGDPHLASRVPGFRRDDYPRAILEKLRWCLEHARAERLLPVVLGDLFHWPRDNANWLLGEVLALLAGHEVLAVAGNHDCRVNALEEDDSLSVLAKAGRIRLLREEAPWRGTLAGRAAVVGGTPWGERLPEAGPDEDAFVVWICHHDVGVPGYEEQARLRPRELPGIDVVVNGHVHRRLEDHVVGRTTWLTPGSITRVSRSDAARRHVPAALRIDVGASGFSTEPVPVPHAPFEEVFHPEVVADEPEEAGSAFVEGLAELRARRTDSGAGLTAFLDRNLDRYPDEVATEIRALAEEVLADGS